MDSSCDDKSDDDDRLKIDCGQDETATNSEIDKEENTSLNSSEECEEDGEEENEDSLSESDYLRKLSACILPVQEGEDDYVEKKVEITDSEGCKDPCMSGEDENDDEEEVEDESDECAEESKSEAASDISEQETEDECKSESFSSVPESKKKPPMKRSTHVPQKCQPTSKKEPPKMNQKSNKLGKELSKHPTSAGGCTPVETKFICKEKDKKGKEEQPKKRPCKKVIIPPNVNKARIKLGSLVIDVDDTLKDKFETNVYATNVGNKDLHVKTTVSADCYEIDVDSLKDKLGQKSQSSERHRGKRSSAGMSTRRCGPYSQSLGNIKTNID